MFTHKLKQLHYKELFVYGAYMTILVLSVLASFLDFFWGKQTDVYIDILFALLTFMALKYSFYKQEIERSALLLFWIAVFIEYLFLVTNKVDFDLIFAVFIPIIAFISLPRHRIVFHLSMFYILLILFLIYYYNLYPQHPFLHNTKYMIAYFMAHAFMVAYGVFYFMAIDESVKRLEVSNQEKALLLKEVHHRVKNNLNLIASILGLQENRYQNLETKKTVADNRKRIESMAILHEILYQNKDLKGVDLESYMDTLIDHIVECEALGEKVSIERRILPIRLTMDAMIQFGIMLNEMLTNSIKYAADQKGRIEIEIVFSKEDKGYQLHYCDHAMKIDEVRLQSGFGYSLIMLTAAQLRGLVDVQIEDGLCYHLYFETLEEIQWS